MTRDFVTSAYLRFYRSSLAPGQESVPARDASRVAPERTGGESV